MLARHPGLVHKALLLGRDTHLMCMRNEDWHGLGDHSLLLLDGLLDGRVVTFHPVVMVGHSSARIRFSPVVQVWEFCIWAV